MGGLLSPASPRRIRVPPRQTENPGLHIIKSNVIMSISSEDASILQSIKGHTSDVTSCDFAPNFNLVTGSSDKTVRIWEWIPGTGYSEKSNSPLRGHTYGVTCVRVSPQGSMLASASVDGNAILWNFRSGQKLHTMVQLNGDSIRVCRFAPDSSVLITGGDNGAICIWDLVHRTLVRTILQHQGATCALAVTSDSQYVASACSSEYLHIWHLQDVLDTTHYASISPVCSVDNAHDLGFLCLDFCPIITTDDDDPFIKKYTLAASGNNEEIKIWTVTAVMVPKQNIGAGSASMVQTGVFQGHNSAVTCIRYSNSGLNLVSGSLDKKIKIWDNNGACIFTLESHTRYVNCVAFSRDFTLVASGSSGSNDKNVIVWDLTNSLTLDSELIKAHSHLSALLIPAGIQEDDVVEDAESQDNVVELIDKIEDIFEGAINSCCFHENSYVATGSSDKLVRIFKVNDENKLEEMTNSPIEEHSYSVNHVEFSRDGSMLASCSLDGCVFLWDPMTCEKLGAVPENRLGIRVCRFSPDATMLITAGDDEIAVIWDVESKEAIRVFEDHMDAITSACFTPDGKLIVTTCHNSDFRLWTLENQSYIQSDAHDLGIQSCDFSQNLDPVPNDNSEQTYMLVTSGNDSLVKLWAISIDKMEDFNTLQVKLWSKLEGHGGTVFSVRFSPGAGELICSTATDHQARIWSVYSSLCLHVLNHDSIVTSCAFSQNCALLITGCFDKTLWTWKLPQQLVFQTVVANKLKSRVKPLNYWTNHDVVKWLKDVELIEITENVQNTYLDGEKIITLPEENICVGLDIDEELSKKLTKELKWLKQDEKYFNINYWNKINDVPDEYICPITHEIMRQPVTVCDGFTYEKRAITEWFMSGKFTSPMTNGILENTEMIPNHELRNNIHMFLYDEEPE